MVQFICETIYPLLHKQKKWFQVDLNGFAPTIFANNNKNNVMILVTLSQNIVLKSLQSNKSSHEL